MISHEEELGEETSVEREERRRGEFEWNSSGLGGLRFVVEEREVDERGKKEGRRRGRCATFQTRQVTEMLTHSGIDPVARMGFYE